MGRGWWCAWLVVTTACGRIGFDPSRDGGARPDGDGVVGDHVVSLQASNPSPGDQFGFTVALSGDGSTLAATAIREASAATGIDGNQADESASRAGAVYVFVRAGDSYTQQAYVKASNTGMDDAFGQGLALSADGNTLAVGAYLEDSPSATAPNDNSSADSGAVYIFTRTGASWAQQAFLKASDPQAGATFGSTLALSGDGNTLAVVADGRANGGALYVFTRSGTTWSQQALAAGSNTDPDDAFGDSVTISADGDTIVVGAPDEDSGAVGIGGNESDNTATDAGAAYVFVRAGATWSQQAYVKAGDTSAGDAFGNRSCGLTADGNTMILGAPQQDTTATDSGAAYLYRRSGPSWTQVEYFKAPNAAMDDLYGFRVAISGDGAVIAIGAHQQDDVQPDSGAVYLMQGGTTRTLKAPNPGDNDRFGFSTALSTDGTTLAVGAIGRDNQGGVFVFF